MASIVERLASWRESYFVSIVLEHKMASESQSSKNGQKVRILITVLAASSTPMTNLRRFAASLAALAILYAGLASAALNDTFPADFVALPEGRATTTFYVYDRKQDGVWTKGQRAGDLHLGSTIAAVRLNRFYRLGEWKLAPLVVFSATDTALSGNSVPVSYTHLTLPTILRV